MPAQAVASIAPLGIQLIQVRQAINKDSAVNVVKQLLKMCGEAPYTGKLDEIQTIAVNPNGDVVICGFEIGNIVHGDITEIINRYDPYKNPMMSALIRGGVTELIKYAEDKGITTDTSKSYSTCDVCSDIVKRMTKMG
jgi:hypothetical protein